MNLINLLFLLVDANNYDKQFTTSEPEGQTLIESENEDSINMHFGPVTESRKFY